MTKKELFALKAKGIDENIKKNTKSRWDSISKPLDGLGDFEIFIINVFAILGAEEVEEFKKALVIMCADNGIVCEGVTQCGQENTYLVAKLLGQNRSTASTMAGFAGVKCFPVDIGINSEECPEGVLDRKVRKGTNDFLKEKSMSEDEAVQAIETGICLMKKLKDEGYNLVATGEMGIGNTTTGTALLCALTDINPDDVVGRGAGLSDEGLARKKQVIKDGLKLHGLGHEDNSMSDTAEYALNALTSVGGLDIAAMAGLYIGGAIYGIPVVIDGLISAVAALVASRIMPESVNYMIPSHSGREKGTLLVLDELGLVPYINGDMALGEGTGALMAMPLFDMILDFFNKAVTFSEGNIEKYKRQN